MMTKSFFLLTGQLSICSVPFILGAIVGEIIVMLIAVRIPNLIVLMADSFAHAWQFVWLSAKRSVK